MVNFQLKNSQAWDLVCLLREVYSESPPEKGEIVAGILNAVIEGQWKLKYIMGLSLDAGYDPEKQREVEREFERWVSQDK